ncbi:DUF6155 family protein [Flavobacterium sp.]|uniref:DUF6155 family protein n=1 Tax=Flavobacterium sp. TaxID=239 RepID=UPI002487243A|nr:DUF6155 family protein [Flavobacterium sp.]MDI1317541.1 DUF6155 family protein [Flavobacterium sp.]
MSKRDLKKYIRELSKEQLEEQIIELYDKFSTVKVYYDFAFNPNEKKLIDEAKVKIANEYFPSKGKRSKMRRTVAQKYIKHFLTLGVDIFMIADLMFFTIETAMSYSSKRQVKYETFFKSIFLAYHQAVTFSIENGILSDFLDRVVAINEEANRQNWINKYEFNAFIEKVDDNFL